MKYICIFSGISAPTVAWKSLSWRSLAFAEIDPFCSAVLAHHYPIIPNLGDVLKVNWQQWRDQAQVLVAGSPCQDFSGLGEGLSLEGERGRLTLKVADIWHDTRTPFLVYENVPRLLNAKSNAFGVVLARLVGAAEPLQPGRTKRWSNAGLVVGEDAAIAWRILDSQCFGLPHRRRRVFLVGINFRNAARFFGTTPRVVKERLGALPAGVLFESESKKRLPPAGSKAVAATTTTARGSAEDQLLAFSFKDNGGDVGTVSPTLRSLNHTNSWPNSGSHVAIAYSRAAGIAYQDEQEYGLRRLTPVEVLRLQGFPDSYLDIDYRSKPAADGHKYHACGNTMSVPVIRWVGNRLDSLVGVVLATKCLDYFPAQNK